MSTLDVKEALTIKDEYGGLVGKVINPSGNYGDEIVIGGIDFVAKSANAEITELPFDEHIHIVPIEVGNTKLVGNVFWDYGLSGPPSKWIDPACYMPATLVDYIMTEVVYTSLPANKEKYMKYKYTTGKSGADKAIKGRIYKIFLKTSVLEDPQLKNNDIFNPYDSTMRYPKTVMPQAQEDTSQKQNILYGGKDSIYKTVTKIMYILKYGPNAKGVYENRIDAKGNKIAKKGQLGLDTNNYKNLMGRSVRLLWAEYQFGQLHRGVDFYYEEGTPVYAICGGTVFKSVNDPTNEYSIYIHTNDYGAKGKGITVIYCHCKDLIIGVGDSVVPGQQIGKLGRNAHKDLGKTPPHVHIEINPGNHAKKSKGITVYDIENPLGLTVEKTALNPYAYFRSMWSNFPNRPGSK